MLSATYLALARTRTGVMGEPQVRLDEVGLTLPSAAGDVEILRGISLEIAGGERVAVTGPSGSGKSSLLMVMGGLERATAGRAHVLGTDLGAAGEDELARLRRARIGVVFQSFHLIPTMTALENTAVPLEIAGRRDAFDRAAEMLDEVGLAARAEHYPAQLSGGEQQRVAIARALAPGPELLLADEPTGNLDGGTGAQITELLFRLADEGEVTLVLVTHEPDLASRCGRQVELASGRIVGRSGGGRRS
jgi:putative ABC transport system ATP-binding protein